MADDLATVLELLHTSDNRWRALRAEGEEWFDEERSGEASRRTMRPGPVMSFRGAPGPADRYPRWQVVARTPAVVVAVERVVAYPTGFELGITVRTRDGSGQHSFDEARRREWRGSSAFPGESLRVSVVFADGRRSVAENFGRPPGAASGGPRLLPLSGSGTDTRFDQWFWVEPLPPAGPLGVVVEWGRHGIPESRIDVDAGAIVAAAARAATLWP